MLPAGSGTSTLPVYFPPGIYLYFTANSTPAYLLTTRCFRMVRSLLKRQLLPPDTDVAYAYTTPEFLGRFRSRGSTTDIRSLPAYRAPSVSRSADSTAGRCFGRFCFWWSIDTFPPAVRLPTILHWGVFCDLQLDVTTFGELTAHSAVLLFAFRPTIHPVDYRFLPSGRSPAPPVFELVAYTFATSATFLFSHRAIRWVGLPYVLRLNLRFVLPACLPVCATAVSFAGIRVADVYGTPTYSCCHVLHHMVNRRPTSRLHLELCLHRFRRAFTI